MTSVSQRNHNKRQRVGKLHADERTSSRSKKAGGGFVVSIASTTMTNLVLLAFMLLLAFAPTSSLAEFTNDEVEIGDATNSILEQSEVSFLFDCFLKDRDYHYDTTGNNSTTLATAIILCWELR